MMLIFFYLFRRLDLIFDHLLRSKKWSNPFFKCINGLWRSSKFVIKFKYLIGLFRDLHFQVMNILSFSTTRTFNILIRLRSYWLGLHGLKKLHSFVFISIDLLILKRFNLLIFFEILILKCPHCNFQVFNSLLEIQFIFLAQRLLLIALLFLVQLLRDLDKFLFQILIFFLNQLKQFTLILQLLSWFFRWFLLNRLNISIVFRMKLLKLFGSKVECFLFLIEY
jgi:hypothetical protein